MVVCNRNFLLTGATDSKPRLLDQQSSFNFVAEYLFKSIRSWPISGKLRSWPENNISVKVRFWPGIALEKYDIDLEYLEKSTILTYNISGKVRSEPEIYLEKYDLDLK